MNRHTGNMRARRRFVFSFLLSLAVVSVAGLAASPAVAQSLNDLRASGAIGEGHDGYVRVRKPGGGVQAAADSINAKRRALYAKRAAEQGVSPAQVGQVYARQIVSQAPPGTWFLSSSGAWSQK